MSQNRKNLYRILGIKRSATPEQIIRAYRRLAKIHHPDMGGDVERMKEIQNAFDILSDAEKRARHDRGEEQIAPGQQAKVNDVYEAIQACLISVVADMLKSHIPLHRADVLSSLKQTFLIRRDLVEQQKRQTVKFKEIHFDMLGRFTDSKGNPSEAMAQIIQDNLRQADRDLKIMEDELQRIEKIFEELNNLRFHLGHHLGAGSRFNTSTTGLLYG